MLNLFVTYSLLWGMFLRIYFHGKVVVPGKERSVVRKLFLIYLKCVVWAALLTIGPAFGVGPGYREWWVNYSTQHSMILWAVIVIPITAALYSVKQMTYLAMLRPGHYSMFQGPVPDLCVLNMRLPMLWQFVFWTWILLNPMLPFFNCFLRIFVLRTEVGDIFPYV